MLDLTQERHHGSAAWITASSSQTSPQRSSSCLRTSFERGSQIFRVGRIM